MGSIGEPGTQLTMRTFHIGGIASGSTSESYYQTKTSGIVKFKNLAALIRNNETCITISRKGIIYILDKAHKKKETFSIEYGSTIFVKNNTHVNANTLIAKW